MGATILIVEDNPNNLDLMSYLLTAHGHQIVSATRGEEAVQMARADPPDLVVMDIQLAGSMDGYDTLRLVRDLPRLDAVPVVAVTAYAMEGDITKALEAGFNGFLTKPIDPFVFVSEIERHLPPPLKGQTPLPTSGTGKDRAEKAAEAGQESSQQGPAILVVDDLPTNRDLFHAILESRGYQVHSAATIEEALASARAHHPVMVLSDIDVGYDSGVDLARTLRTTPEFADIVVVLTTASSPPGEKTDAAEALGVPVIMRPIDPAALLAKVAELLPSASSG